MTKWIQWVWKRSTWNWEGKVVGGSKTYGGQSDGLIGSKHVTVMYQILKQNSKEEEEDNYLNPWRGIEIKNRKS